LSAEEAREYLSKEELYDYMTSGATSLFEEKREFFTKAVCDKEFLQYVLDKGLFLDFMDKIHPELLPILLRQEPVYMAFKHLADQPTERAEIDFDHILTTVVERGGRKALESLLHTLKIGKGAANEAPYTPALKEAHYRMAKTIHMKIGVWQLNGYKSRRAFIGAIFNWTLTKHKDVQAVPRDDLLERILASDEFTKGKANSFGHSRYAPPRRSAYSAAQSGSRMQEDDLAL